MNPSITPESNRFWKQAAAALLWVGIWQVLSLLIGQDLLLPGPVAVAEQLAALVQTSAFWLSIGASLLRVLLGLLIGTLAGTLFAALSHRFAWLSVILAPLLRLTRTVPVVSFIILAIVWLSRNMLPVLISALVAMPLVWQNVAEGIRKTDIRYLEAARVYRVPALRKLGRLYVPSVKPYFASALITASGFAWKAGIAAEVLYEPVLSVGKGLGEAKTYLNTAELFAWTAVIVLIGWSLERLIRLLLRETAQRSVKV